MKNNTEGRFYCVFYFVGLIHESTAFRAIRELPYDAIWFIM